MRSSIGFSQSHAGTQINKFYLRNVTASAFPTLGHKTAILPVGTFADGATDAEEKLSLLATPGTVETNGNAKVSSHSVHIDVYQARFSSAPVAAGTYGAGTWTFATQATESNTGANQHIMPVVYFWRPSTSAVVGYVYEADTHLGPEFGNGNANTLYGLAQNFTGSNVTVLNGDILVLEVWHGGTPTYGHKITYKLYYDGTTDPSAGSVELSTASYLQAPTSIQMY